MPETANPTSKVQRGVVTVAGRRTEPKVGPPIIHVMAAPPPPPPEATYRYVTNMGRFHQIGIPEPAKDDESDGAILTRATLAYHPEAVIQFRNWEFETSARSVATWLDKRIASGALAGVARDSAQMRIRCTLCDHTELNTPNGREAMLLHTMTAHETEEDDGELTAILPPQLSPRGEQEREP